MNKVIQDVLLMVFLCTLGGCILYGIWVCTTDACEDLMLKIAITSSVVFVVLGVLTKMLDK